MVTTYPNVELGQGTIRGTATLPAARQLGQEARPACEVAPEQKIARSESSFFTALLRAFAAFAV